METSPLPSGLPVIIGTGVGALFVSHFLSEAGVEHVLLGPEPDPKAFRLGESMAFEGAYALRHLFGEHAAYFHEKTGVAFYTSGGDVLRADLTAINTHPLIHFSCALTGSAPPHPRSMHVDRYGFDAALYASLVQRPEVRRVVGTVERVERERDRVTALVLDGQRRIQPSFVYDVSNFGRVLGRAFDIPWVPLGPPEKLVAALLGAPDGEAPSQCDWRQVTQLVIVGGDSPELPPNGWVIAMGSRCSVGITVAADDPRGPEALLTLLADAAREVGCSFGEYWPKPLKQISGPLRYGRSARAMGENWMMVGGAALNMHFATSAGLEVTLATARMAPEALRDAAGVAARYEPFLQKLLASDSVIRRFRMTPTPTQDRKLLQRWIGMNMNRTLSLRSICGTPFNRFVASLYPLPIRLVVPLTMGGFVALSASGGALQRIEDRETVMPSAK